VEIDMEVLRTKHQEELALLKNMIGRGRKDERKGHDPPVFNGNQKELEG
jgi:hypothetical protein